MEKVYAEMYRTFEEKNESKKTESKEFFNSVNHVIEGCKQKHPAAILEMNGLIQSYKKYHGLENKTVGFVANLTDENIIAVHFDHTNPQDGIFDLHYDEKKDRHYILVDVKKKEVGCMTFKEAMIQELVKRGMFPQQAEQIMSEFIDEGKNEMMNDRWFETIDSYPPGMLPLLWLEIKEYAYNWIEKNLPQAWFKPMFQYTPEQLNQMIEDKKNAKGK